jgi:zinc protease
MLARVSPLFRAWTRFEMVVLAAIILIGATASFTNTARAMDIQVVKSPGGIEAWLVEEPSIPLVAMRFAFIGGNSQDPDGKEGLANVLSTMLDEGAGDLDAAAFQKRLEDLAVRMGFSDGRDTFSGSFQSLSENLDAGAELLKLALTKPRFDDDALERMRKSALSRLAFQKKNPNSIASRAWSEAAFPNHPYGRPSDGTEESVSAITADDLETYRKRIFAQDTLKIAVVGDIDAERLGRLLDNVFGDLPEKSERKPVAKVEPTKGGVQKVVEMPFPQSVALFGVGAVERKDPDFIPAFVMNQILGGGGFASRLMEEVREKRGLAYSVYSYLQPYDHASIFAGGVATQNERIAESLTLIRSELKRMADDGPTPEELENAKQYLTGSYALRFDTNTKIAQQLLGIQLDNLGIDYVVTRNQQIAAVTIEDVKRAAKRVLDVDNLIVTVVGRPVGLGG